MASATLQKTNGVADLKFDSIPDAIEAFRNGDFIIVLDSPRRENEGDLIAATAALTPEKLSFFIRHTSGLICVPMESSRADALDLPEMVPAADNRDPNGTAYTVSVDSSATGITTGISALDRCRTCVRLGDADAGPGDFRRPGHVFPLRARDGGVRVRRGHTEAAVEFAKLAGFNPPVAAICELVDAGVEVGPAAARTLGGIGEPGVANGMLRARGCVEFGRTWGIKVVTIEDLVAYLDALK